eukprot:scaffold81106_cov31-Tisochrysis_lutea.AAC.7
MAEGRFTFGDNGARCDVSCLRVCMLRACTLPRPIGRLSGRPIGRLSGRKKLLFQRRMPSVCVCVVVLSTDAFQWQQHGPRPSPELATESFLHVSACMFKLNITHREQTMHPTKSLCAARRRFRQICCLATEGGRSEPPKNEKL